MSYSIKYKIGYLPAESNYYHKMTVSELMNYSAGFFGLKDWEKRMNELAKLLKRDIKNTFDDVQFLAQMGLIELKKTREGREKTTPKVNYDRILLEIPV